MSVVSRKITIYVRPDLKSRIDANTEDINWSAIACQAFEARLSGQVAAEISSRKQKIRVTVELID